MGIKTRFVYCIKNNITNECYIGSTSDLKRRYQWHYSSKASPLYNDLRKLGRQNFTISVIDQYQGHDWDCSQEKQWIQKLKPFYNRDKCEKKVCAGTWYGHPNEIRALHKKAGTTKKSQAIGIAIKFFLKSK